MNDLRFSARLLGRSPVFTACAVLLLAAGIGGATLIFSAFDALLLRPLPVDKPEELVRLVQRPPRVGTASSFGHEFYEALRGRSAYFSQVFGETQADVAMVDPLPAERVRVHLSTTEYFQALGVPALYGRVLTPDDAQENGGAPPAVLSHAFWQRRFQGDPAVIGRSIRLKGHEFVIVGVMPRAFNGTAADSAPDIRVPWRARTLLIPEFDDPRLDLSARLKPEATAGQALDESRAIFAATLKPQPDGRPAFDLQYPLELDPLAQGVSILRDRYGGVLKALLASVALLQLLVCANLAGLVLARAAGRRHEMAVRLAVGASPARLVRQMLTESLLLAVLGGIGGTLFATLLAGPLMRALPPIRDLTSNLLPLTLNFGLDGRVLIFSIAVSVATLVLFGLGPAVAASRTSLDSVLRSVRSVAGGRGRQTLIALQVALCTVLLIGAGLFVRTFQRLRGTDPGFTAARVVTFTLDPTLSGYSMERANQLSRSLHARVLALPGVESAAFSMRALMRDRGVASSFRPAGEPGSSADFLNTDLHSVSHEYFDTMGIRLVAGRTFRADDDMTVQPQKTVVNEAFARRFFPGQDPIGKRFGFSREGQITQGTSEIIGVVADAKYRSLRQSILPTTYGLSPTGTVLHVKTRLAPASIVPAVRQALASLDAALPFTEVHTMEEELNASAAGERLAAILASIFGSVAAFLSAVGIYGLLAHAVAARRREIGVRMALGADAANIGALVGRWAGGAVAAGIGGGLAAALLVAPWIEATLWQVAPRDPASFGAATGVVAVVAALAAAIPLIRAIGIDPAVALRDE